MQSVQPQVEALHKLQSDNKVLREHNKTLSTQLEIALSDIRRLEKRQVNANRLDMQNRGLEVTVATLASFINDLIEKRINIEIPGEVRRVISQVSLSEKQKEKCQQNLVNIGDGTKPQVVNPMKPMVKSLSTGRIGVGVALDDAMLRSNSLNMKDSASKGGFFAKSYNHILQRQLDKRINSCKVLEKCTENDESNSSESNKTSPTHDADMCGRSTINADLRDFCLQKYDASKEYLILSGDVSEKTSPVSATDSGIVTPSSPKDIEHHPLSNCDVNFTFNGTRELRKVKSFRNFSNNSNSNMIAQ